MDLLVSRTAAVPARSPSRCRQLDWGDAVAPLPRVLAWASRNQLAVTACLSVFLVLKVLVIAKGDVATALGVLRTAGLQTIVVGGLPAGLTVVVGVLLARTTYAWMAHGWSVPRACVWSGLLLLSFFLTPSLLMLVGLAPLALWLPRGVRHLSRTVHPRPGPAAEQRSVDEPKSAHARRVLAPLLVGVLLAYPLFEVLYAVWLPRETLQVTSQQDRGSAAATIEAAPATRTGYVLDDSGSWTSVLASGSRRIYRYRSGAGRGPRRVPQARHVNGVGHRAVAVAGGRVRARPLPDGHAGLRRQPLVTTR